MDEKDIQTRRLEAPVERLLRHLAAVGLLDAERPSADERLSDELGDELLAVVRVGLGHAVPVDALNRAYRAA